MFKKLANSELGRPSAEEYREMDKLPVVVVMDNVRSQHNIGSVFRTSDAFLAERVILCGICATPPTPEIHKSALGAEMTVAWEYAREASEAVRKLKGDGYTVIAVEQTHNSVSVENLSLERDKKYALVFGNEVKGVSQEVIDLCDSTLEIPQWGTKHSLNVSVSAGVVLWEVCKSLRALCVGFVFLIMGMSLSSCHFNKIEPDEDFPKKVEFYEKMASSITNIDTLIILAEFYQESGNVIVERAFRNQLGVQYRNESKFGESIEQHLKALQISRFLIDTLGLVHSLNHVGIDYYRLGSVEDASSFCFMALDYCELYSDKNSPRALNLLSHTLKNVGTIYLSLLDYESAERVFRRSLEIDKEITNEEGFAAAYMNLGYIHEQKGNLDSAQVCYQASMSYNYKTNSALGIAKCHQRFGSLSEKRGDYQGALSEYHQSYSMLKKESDYYHRVDVSLSLANLYAKMGDMVNALNYANMALERSEEILAADLLTKAYIIRSEIHMKKGDYKSAINDYRRANLVENENISDNKMMELQQRRIEEVKRRNVEALRLRDEVIVYERDSKHKLLLSSVIISTMLMVIIFLLVKNYLISRRSIRTMEEAESMRTDFYTRVTHEFRTPLSIILGHADMISRREKDPKVKGMASSISLQGHHLVKIVNELLDIAKLGNSVNMPDFQRGDIVLLWRMMTDSFRTVANGKMVNLDFASDVSSIQMDFIPYYMTKISLNLISNAIKFTPKGHNIYVTLALNGENVEITVADTGDGIDSEDLENIFEPFYQGKNSKADLGTGIGLSLVHQMTLAMGGKIEVFSIKGEGTSFVINIPQYTSLQDDISEWNSKTFTTGPVMMSVSDADGEVQLNDPQADLSEHHDKPVVLIVEDHQEIAHYITQVLGDGYTYLFADSGITAIEKAGEYLPEIIITDLMMPQMDGYEFIRSVRASDTLRLIPIVVVSALNDIDDKVKAISLGADAFITKPFDPRELLGTVSNILIKISERQKSLTEKFTRAKGESWQEENDLVSPQDREFLVKLHQVIHSNISSSELNSEFIAEKVFLSRSQVNRKVKSLTGMDTNAFIRYNRLAYARELLIQSDLPIGEILLKSGFDHQSYFSRQFKLQYGITPTEARNDKMALSSEK